MFSMSKAFFAASSYWLAVSAVTNPSDFVLSANFADPRSLYYDGTYYAFATNEGKSNTSEPDRNVPVATSKSFSTGWQYSKAQVLPDAGKWTASPPNVWDPSVYAYNSSHFVMYYAAIPKAGGKHCIGVATATSVLGTYKPQQEALICNNGSTGFISPSPFMYKGKPYIVHKKGAQQQAAIILQQLSTDGTATVGEGIELVHEAGNEYDTEGPFMTFNPNANGHPILLFVTGFYRDLNYKIQYAVAPTNALVPPTGQHYIVNDVPLLQTGKTNGVQVYGPGGPYFPRKDAPHEMTFMADRSAKFSDGRSMRTANVTFAANNTLSIH